jgi:hypothetical protein
MSPVTRSNRHGPRQEPVLVPFDVQVAAVDDQLGTFGHAPIDVTAYLFMVRSGH